MVLLEKRGPNKGKTALLLGMDGIMIKGERRTADRIQLILLLFSLPERTIFELERTHMAQKDDKRTYFPQRVHIIRPKYTTSQGNK